MTLKYLNRILLEEASAFIEHLPNKCVDLVLTDPPYNLLEDEIEYYHLEFQRISCHGIIVFMPPENPWVFPSDQYLFWEKEHSTNFCHNATSGKWIKYNHSRSCMIQYESF